jgi:hypothetical protein
MIIIVWVQGCSEILSYTAPMLSPPLAIPPRPSPISPPLCGVSECILPSTQVFFQCMERLLHPSSAPIRIDSLTHSNCSSNPRSLPGEPQCGLTIEFGSTTKGSEQPHTREARNEGFLKTLNSDLDHGKHGRHGGASRFLSVCSVVFQECP